MFSANSPSAFSPLSARSPPLSECFDDHLSQPNSQLPAFQPALEKNTICALSAKFNATELVHQCCGIDVAFEPIGCWEWCNYTQPKANKELVDNSEKFKKCIKDGAAKMGRNISGSGVECFGPFYTAFQNGDSPRPGASKGSWVILGLVLGTLFLGI